MDEFREVPAERGFFNAAWIIIAWLWGLYAVGKWAMWSAGVVTDAGATKAGQAGAGLALALGSAMHFAQALFVLAVLLLFVRLSRPERRFVRWDGAARGDAARAKTDEASMYHERSIDATTLAAYGFVVFMVGGALWYARHDILSWLYAP